MFLRLNRNNFQSTQSILTLRSHRNRCYGSRKHTEALCAVTAYAMVGRYGVINTLDV